MQIIALDYDGEISAFSMTDQLHITVENAAATPLEYVYILDDDGDDDGGVTRYSIIYFLISSHYLRWRDVITYDAGRLVHEDAIARGGGDGKSTVDDEEAKKYELERLKLLDNVVVSVANDARYV